VDTELNLSRLDDDEGAMVLHHGRELTLSKLRHYRRQRTLATWGMVVAVFAAVSAGLMATHALRSSDDSENVSSGGVEPIIVTEDKISLELSATRIGATDVRVQMIVRNQSAQIVAWPPVVDVATPSGDKRCVTASDNDGVNAYCVPGTEPIESPLIERSVLPGQHTTEDFVVSDGGPGRYVISREVTHEDGRVTHLSAVVDIPAGM